MKTVIQVWKQKCISHTNEVMWGFGDMIRGTIFLYQLSKKLNFNLIVDIKLHPISEYLVIKENKYHDLVLQNKDNILFITDSIKYINNNKNDIIMFFTSQHCKLNEIDVDCRNFIKDILTPNDKLLLKLTSIRNTLPTNYNILHYRLGDNEMVNNNTNQNDINYIEHLKRNWEVNDLFISDSESFKNKLRNSGILMIDTKIAHIGWHDMLEDTLIEFFLITTSNKIKTYSFHGWTSGFVSWIHTIYEIPLIDLKNGRNITYCDN